MMAAPMQGYGQMPTQMPAMGTSDVVCWRTGSTYGILHAKPGNVPATDDAAVNAHVAANANDNASAKRHGAAECPINDCLPGRVVADGNGDNGTARNLFGSSSRNNA